MKKFRIYASILIVAVSLSVLTSCEKENSEDSSLIIGTWENDQDWGICIFYSNGTCVLDGADADYEYKDGMIYFTYVGGGLDGIRDTYEVIKLTNSEMIWHTDDNYEEYPDGNVYFKRVK
jgi:hypothetical protein